LKRSVVAPLLLLLGLSGCMKIRQELLVLPDGSGRLTMTFTLKGGGDASSFTQAELMSADPDEIFQKVRGLAALTRPVLEKKDGVVRIRLTGYFDDLNALKFMDDGEGDHAKPKQEFRYTREGEAATLEIRGNLLAEEGPAAGARSPEFDQHREDLMKSIFAGFEFRSEVRLPGRVTIAEGFASKQDRNVIYSVGEKDLQTLADQKKINDAVRFKVSCGKSELSPEETAAFRKELEAAKAGWEELKKEMKRK